MSSSAELSSSTDERLSQYFDGELGAEDAEALRAELESDAELSAKLEGLERLSVLLKASAEELGDELDTGALFAGISERLAQDEADDDDGGALLPGPSGPETPEAEAPEAEDAEVRARPALRVVPGGKQDDPPAPAREVARAAPPRRRAGVVLAVGSLLAAAAALLFFIYRGPGRGSGPDDGAVLAENDPVGGSEVEEVDFGYSTGAIFSVEDEEGERYAVVWISDEKVEDDEEERLQ